MSFPPPRRRALVAAGLLLLLGGCFGDGCVRGQVESFARYDPAADSFAFLDVYANINSWKEAHHDRVADLWARRANLIVDPRPRLAFFGTQQMIERLGPHSYRVVDLGAKPAEEAPAVETAVDLDSIRVVPGEFFRNEHGGLTYSQVAEAPGAAVDAFLREQAPQIAGYLGEFAREDANRARQPGAAALTWDGIRAEMVAELDKRPKPAVAADAPPQAGPLDAESLRRFERATADGTVRLDRRGATFTLTVPVSARDAAEAVATLESCRREVARRRAAGQAVEPDVIRILDAVELRPDAAGLVLTLRGERALAAAARAPRPMPAPDPMWRDALPATIAAIRARGIAVDDADLFPAILRRFRAPGRVP